MKTKKSKSIKEVVTFGDTMESINDFSNRFNISFDISNRLAFKQRCLNAIGKYFASAPRTRDLIIEHLSTLLAFPHDSGKNILETSYSGEYFFQRTDIYKFFNNKSWDLSNNNLIYIWLMTLEAILNFPYENSIYYINNFANEVAIALKLSDVNAILCITPKGYKFYPAGAELLDKKLVIDVLNWLNAYPKAKEKYELALSKFLKSESTRDIIDDSRLSLEIFLKSFLNNNKSLENQKSVLGIYLSEKNSSKEITNMFNSLFDLYTKYNNKNIKHDDGGVSVSEAEFLLYLTGSFIRFIITLKRQEQQKMN